MERYFAYGSNLSAARMQQRVPAARALGPARLPGHRLTFDKIGRDGSGKANLRPAPADSWVWGVAYVLDSAEASEAADWSLLDRFEPGYRRLPVEVESLRGEWISAFTYRSDQLTEDPVPHEWYKRLVVDGAREQGLPDVWVAALERTPSRD